MIIFRKISSPEPVVNHIHQTIDQKLSAGRKVLWLLSGGSFIPIQVEVAKRLSSQPNLKQLAVTLTDERYGPVGHPDSNWQKLLEAGFSLSGAQLHPVLEGSDIAQTTADFSGYLSSQLTTKGYKLACVGVGADGHTLGVIPGSLGFDSHELAVSYQAFDFQRITMTLGSLVHLDEAAVYMVGKEKWPLIDQLTDKSIPLDQQPAQALKQVKKLTIYNDYKGEET